MRSLLLVALAVLLAAPASAGTAAARPRLTLGGTHPVVARGERFRPNEQVVLLVVGEGSSKQSVRTGATGTFRVALKERYDRCRGLTVQAFGPRGERASAAIAAPGCSSKPPGVSIPDPGD